LFYRRLKPTNGIVEVVQSYLDQRNPRSKALFDLGQRDQFLNRCATTLQISSRGSNHAENMQAKEAVAHYCYERLTPLEGLFVQALIALQHCH